MTINHNDCKSFLPCCQALNSSLALAADLEETQ